MHDGRPEIARGTCSIWVQRERHEIRPRDSGRKPKRSNLNPGTEELSFRAQVRILMMQSRRQGCAMPLHLTTQIAAISSASVAAADPRLKLAVRRSDFVDCMVFFP
jgi:hypothetical protein